jgi:hypothetical protein
MELYRIEVGRDDGVEVRHIVGAIANEGDISSRYIGNIKLFGTHSTIELPKGMPGEVLQHFTRTRILNKPMNMQLLGDAQPRPERGGERRGNGERREASVVANVVKVVAASVVSVVKAVVVKAVTSVVNVARRVVTAKKAPAVVVSVTHNRSVSQLYTS